MTSDGSPRLDAAGLARDADEVAEIEVELLLDDQLDAPGAVDEVEEDELPHLAPRHDPPGDAELGVERLPRLGLLGLGANGGDLVPVRKPLGQHRRESSAASPGSGAVAHGSADRVGIGAEVAQDLGCDSLVLPRDGEQDVLGPGLRLSDARQPRHSASSTTFMARGVHESSLLGVAAPGDHADLRADILEPNPSYSSACRSDPIVQASRPSRKCSVPR